MSDAVTVLAPPTDRPDVDPDPGDEVLDELLVEEISIDGMCGVY